MGVVVDLCYWIQQLRSMFLLKMDSSFGSKPILEKAFTEQKQPMAGSIEHRIRVNAAPWKERIVGIFGACTLSISNELAYVKLSFDGDIVPNNSRS